MAEPFDSLAASIADVIDRLAKGEITEAQAAALLAPLLALVSDGEYGAKVEQVVGVLGRVSGMIVVEVTPPATRPSNLIGAPGGFAWDPSAKVFYGPKDAVTGWPAGVSMTQGPAGPSVQMQVSATHIQWRVTGTPTWNNLIALSALKGADGQQVSLQKSATHIQWRLGTEAWVDLIPVADLKGDPGAPGDPGADGDDGRSVELQKSPTHVQWRKVGDSVWSDLVLLSDLRGDPGADGSDGADGQEVGLQTTSTHIQWRLGSGGWINLIALDLLKGGDGADGREVELQTTASHIQWRREGDPNWTDLIARSLLKGDRGEAFTVNAQGDLAGRAAYDAEPVGFSYLDVVAGNLYFRVAPTGWSTPIPFGKGDPGADGNDGREVQLQKSATHIQWRYTGDTEWTNLVALADLKGAPGTDGTDGNDGADGSEVALQKTATHIQWRLGSGPWADLVALADLTGADGSDATVTDQAVKTALGFTPADAADTYTKGEVDAAFDALPDPPAVPTFATVAEVRAGKTGGKIVDPDAAAGAMASVPLTDAATVAVNLDIGPNFTLTTTTSVGVGRTIGAPTDGNVGQYYTIRITAHAGATVAWNTAFKWPGGKVEAIANTAGAITEVAFKMVSGTRFDVVGFVKDIR